MTTTEIATTPTEVAVREAPGSDLLIAPGQTMFSPAQIASLRQIGVEDASEEDLRVFFHQCVRTGLDPFLRQIYLIGRDESKQDPRTKQWVKTKKYTIQTGVDGYRLVARRAAERAGVTLSYEAPMWCGPDGKWKDVWVSPNPPAAARTVVLRDGERFPGVVMYAEFVQMTGPRDAQKPNAMWSRMPAAQLSKCSEVRALRMAFPHDLSGIYIDEEMPHQVIETDGEPVTVKRRPGSKLRAAVMPPAEPETVDAAPTEPAVEPPTREQFADMNRLFAALNVTDKDAKLKAAGEALGSEVTDPTTLTRAQMDAVVAHLEQQVANAALIDPKGAQMKRMMVLLKEADIPEPQQHDFVAGLADLDSLESFKDLTVGQAHSVIAALLEITSQEDGGAVEKV